MKLITNSTPLRSYVAASRALGLKGRDTKAQGEALGCSTGKSGRALKGQENAKTRVPVGSIHQTTFSRALQVAVRWACLGPGVTPAPPRALLSRPFRPGEFVLLALTIFSFLVAPTARADAEVVHPRFDNYLKNSTSNPPAHVSSSAYMISGGSVHPHLPAEQTAVVPTAADTGIQLVQSGYGQMLSETIPYPNFVLDIAGRAHAAMRTAFRYKHELYEEDTNTGAITLNSGELSDLFDDGTDDDEKGDTIDEIGLTETALAEIRSALKYAPVNEILWGLYLDIFYDQTLALLQPRRSLEFQLTRCRLGLEEDAPTNNVLDGELLLQQQIHDLYRNALTSYSELFADRNGVDLATVDLAAPVGIPLGYYLFQQRQPRRDLEAGTFLNSSGDPVHLPVFDPETGTFLTTVDDTDRVLYNGYKDFALVISLVRGYAESAAELAQLKGLRQQGNDVQEAFDILLDVHQKVHATCLLLHGMFPGADFSGHPSGIGAEQDAIQGAVTRLDTMRAFLLGTKNALGFDNDFLVLINGSGVNSALFDSFDVLFNWIDGSDSAPFRHATMQLTNAKDSYGVYTETADKLYVELQTTTDNYNVRSFEVSGELQTLDENIANRNQEIGELQASLAQVNANIHQMEELIARNQEKSVDSEVAVVQYEQNITSLRDEQARWQAKSDNAELYAALAEALGGGHDGAPCASFQPQGDYSALPQEDGSSGFGLTSFNNNVWAPLDTVAKERDGNGKLVLHIEFLNGTVKQKNAVKTHAVEWTNHAALRFVFGAAGGKSDIRINFNDAGLNNSKIGRAAKIVPGKPSMNLSRTTRRTILHEFGHALGFIHEHKSPAAGIVWNEQAVFDAHPHLEPEWVQNNILDAYDSDETRGTGFDPESIMNYRIPAAWVLEPADFEPIPLNTELSNEDKFWVGRVYNPPVTTISDTFIWEVAWDGKTKDINERIITAPPGTTLEGFTVRVYSKRGVNDSVPGTAVAAQIDLDINHVHDPLFENGAPLWYQEGEDVWLKVKIGQADGASFWDQKRGIFKGYIEANYSQN